MCWLKIDNEPEKINKPAKKVPYRNRIMRNGKSNAMFGRIRSILKSINMQQSPNRKSQIYHPDQVRRLETRRQSLNFHEQNEEEQPVSEYLVEHSYNEEEQPVSEYPVEHTYNEENQPVFESHFHHHHHHDR